jgi:NAD+ kinase
MAPHVEEVWVASAWDEEATRGHAEDTDLIISIGGDGTVLRAARAIVPHDVFLLGVNMGRLGFLTELDQSEALERLPDILGGKARIEERAILHADLLPVGGGPASAEGAHFHALNDVVLGRASLGRTVQVTVLVDGSRIADYRADGVVVATATGSTAYALSTGGPILHPESREIVLTPVAPHLVPRNAMVLPADAEVELRLALGQSAVLSIDGESDIDISPEVVVRVTASDHLARFLRLSHTIEFYARVARRLNWLREEEDDTLPEEGA